MGGNPEDERIVGMDYQVAERTVVNHTPFTGCGGLDPRFLAHVAEHTAVARYVHHHLIDNVLTATG